MADLRLGPNRRNCLDAVARTTVRPPIGDMLGKDLGPSPGRRAANDPAPSAPSLAADARKLAEQGREEEALALLARAAPDDMEAAAERTRLQAEIRQRHSAEIDHQAFAGLLAAIEVARAAAEASDTPEAQSCG